MEDVFKKILYTGVGMVTTTRETLTKGVEELISKGKISKEEGEKVVSKMEKNLETKREEFEAGLTNMVGLAMDKLNLPSAELLKRLEKRIKSLEIKVGLLTKELDASKKEVAAAKKQKPVARKTAAKAKVSAN